MSSEYYKSSKDKANDFLKKLGNVIPYKIMCEAKRSSMNKSEAGPEGLKADLSVYSLVSKENGSVVGTLVIRDTVKNEQVMVGIGSNPRKVKLNDPALNTITKLENTRLHIIKAEIINGDSVPAKYLLQFDLSTYASKDNDDFESYFKKNPVDFQPSVQDAYDATAFFLNAIKNSKPNKLNLKCIVLGYGELGQAILDQDVKLNNQLLIKDAYRNLLQEYQEHGLIKQFVLETYPPHSSGNYGSHGVLDTPRYFDNYFN